MKKALLLLLASLLLISCSRKTVNISNENINSSVSPADTVNAVAGDWIVLRMGSDPDRLNPEYTTTAIGTYIDHFVFESLNSMDNVTHELTPGAGSLPVVSKDYLTYTYKVNQNSYFSDGVKLTGDDIIFSLKTIKNPIADNISTRSIYNDVIKAELVDNNKNIVRITVAKALINNGRMLGEIYVVPKHILDSAGLSDKISWEDLKNEETAKKNPEVKKLADLMDRQEVSREPQYLIGSGPYVFEKWVPAQNITLSKNKNYRNTSGMLSYPDKIIWKVISDNSAALIALKNKEIDYTTVSPSLYFQEMGNPADYNLKMTSSPVLSYQFFSWNELNPLFKSKKTRMALAYLIDRKTIVKKILYDQAVLIQSPVMLEDKQDLNTELPEIQFDPLKGKKLLEEDGWKDADGDGILDKVIDGKTVKFKFTLMYAAGVFNKQIMIVYQEELKKTGIEMEIASLEFAVALSRINNHEYEASYSAWYMTPFASDNYYIFHSKFSGPGDANYVSFKSAVSDSLLDAYNNEFDESKRISIMNKWQQVIYDEQPYLFLWTPKFIYVYDQRFKNTRWYASGPELNEWWVPAGMQKYK